MSREQLVRRVYQVLGLPLDDSAGERVEIGWLIPADSPEIVKEISARQSRRIALLLDKYPFQYPENRHVVSQMYFHPYNDFLLSLKHETPSRTEGIPTGHSLGSLDASLPGYLAYLKEKAPRLESFFFTKIAVWVSAKSLRSHGLAIGRTGYGKSNLFSFLLSHFAGKNDCTKILIDPHGNLARYVAMLKQFRITAKHDGSDGLMVISPTLDKSKKLIPGLNPFNLQDRSLEAISGHTEALSNAFEALLREDSLSEAMVAILRPCIWALYYRKKSNFLDLLRFLDDENNEDLVEFGKTLPHPVHAQFFSSKFAGNKSTKDALTRKISNILGSPAVYRILCSDENTMSFREIFDSKKMVVFDLSCGTVGDDSSNALGAFLLAMIVREMQYRDTIPESQHVRVHLFLDEFHRFIGTGGGKYIETILNELRKYSIDVVLAQQFLGQKSKTDFVNTLRNNTNVKFVSNVDANIHQTAESIHVEKEVLGQLDIGEFFVKIGNAPAFRLYTPLMGKSKLMTLQEWEAVRIKQLERYYSTYTGDMRERSEKKEDRVPEREEKTEYGEFQVQFNEGETAPEPKESPKTEKEIPKTTTKKRGPKFPFKQ